MKIVVYKDNLSTGRGADRAVRNFAAGLAERGHHVSLMEKDEFFSSVIGIENETLGDGSFDMIVATGSNEIVDIYRSGYFDRERRAKVVLQLHLAPRGFFKWRHPLRNCRIRKAFNMADAVQVLCSSYAAEFKKIAPRPPITIIGNYTDIQVQEEEKLHEKRPVILYPAAVLNKVKNQRLLIEAFALLASDFPEWKVRLLGKDTTQYAEMCRKVISDKGLDGRIEIVGFTNKLAEEYGNAAFVAFPSTLEGFPLALLEAARFSLAAVTQNELPGIDDIVTENTGIVTKPNPVAYAAGLRMLMADADLCRRLGAAARARCEDRYARSKILDQWEALLESVVQRNAVLVK